MNHSFDTDHAAKYGITEAVILNNFQFWIAKNRANEKHLHDGRTWTYNSVRAFAELFPYLTAKQLRYALDRLVSMGVLVKGNFNDSPYNRTSWYAFQDEESFLPTSGNPLPKKANEIVQPGNSLTDSKQITPPNPKGDASKPKDSSEEFERFWKAWPATDRKVDKKGCLRRWMKAGLDAEAESIIRDVVRRKQTKSWLEGFEPAPVTYINQRRWETEVPADDKDEFGIPF